METSDGGTKIHRPACTVLVRLTAVVYCKQINLNANQSLLKQWSGAFVTD